MTETPAGSTARRPSLTVAGRSAISGSVALGLLGFSLGYPFLCIIAVGGILAVVTAAVSLRGPDRLEISRQLQPLRVERGQPALGLVTVSNPGPRRSSSAVAVEPVGGRNVQIRVPALGPGQTSAIPYRLPTNRRGAIPVGPLTIVRRDPLGLCQTTREAGDQATLWVRPRVSPINARPGGRTRHLEGPKADSAQGSITFHTLREYVAGDDLRRVHWRTSARTDTLMVRQDVDTSLPSTVVVVDDRSDRYHADQFEEAVDVAASVVSASQARGFPVRIVTTSGNRVASRAGQASVHLMDYLSGLQTEPNEAGRGLADLGPEAMRSRDHDALVVICGAVESQDLAAVATLGRPFAVVVLVTVGGEERSGEAFRAGVHLHGERAEDVLLRWRLGGLRPSSPTGAST